MLRDEYSVFPCGLPAIVSPAYLYGGDTAETDALRRGFDGLIRRGDYAPLPPTGGDSAVPVPVCFAITQQGCERIESSLGIRPREDADSLRRLSKTELRRRCLAAEAQTFLTAAGAAPVFRTLLRNNSPSECAMTDLTDGIYSVPLSVMSPITAVKKEKPRMAPTRSAYHDRSRLSRPRQARPRKQRSCLITNQNHNNLAGLLVDGPGGNVYVVCACDQLRSKNGLSWHNESYLLWVGGYNRQMEQFGIANGATGSRPKHVVILYSGAEDIHILCQHSLKFERNFSPVTPCPMDESGVLWLRELTTVGIQELLRRDLENAQAQLPGEELMSKWRPEYLRDRAPDELPILVGTTLELNTLCRLQRAMQLRVPYPRVCCYPWQVGLYRMIQMPKYKLRVINGPEG